jgi:hypothetical protein
MMRKKKVQVEESMNRSRENEYERGWGINRASRTRAPRFTWQSHISPPTKRKNCASQKARFKAPFPEEKRTCVFFGFWKSSIEL